MGYNNKRILIFEQDKIVALETQENKILRERATALYKQNFSTYESVAAKFFTESIHNYLEGYTTRSTFESDMNKVWKTSKDFVRAFSPNIYNEEQKVLTKTIGELYYNYLAGYSTTSTYESELNKIQLVQKEVSPEIIILKLHFVARTEKIQSLLNYCDKKEKQFHDNFLGGYSTQSTFQSEKAKVENARQQILKVHNESSFFKQIDLVASHLQLETPKKHELNENITLEIPKEENKKEKHISVTRIELTPEQRASLTTKATYIPGSPRERVPFEGFRKLMISILKSCVEFLQKNIIDDPEVLNAKKDKEIQEKEKSTAQILLEKKNKITQQYDNILSEVKSIDNISHKEQLSTLLEQVINVFKNNNIYDSLGTEQKFNLEKLYPEVLENIKRQCVLDAENFKLTGQHDVALPVVIATFQEKLGAIFTEKVEKDHKNTEVIKQYLKAKM